MDSTIGLINLLGAGALLLWGLRLIKTGVLRAVWRVVAPVDRQGHRQSGPAASFAGRRMIKPKLAQAVMWGANDDTSIAAVIWTVSGSLLIAMNLGLASKPLLLYVSRQSGRSAAW